MWPFKKKLEVKVEQKTVVKYKNEEMHEVGITLVRLNFEDGSQFHTTIYGRVVQYVNLVEGYVRPIQVLKSDSLAKSFIKEECYYLNVFVNDSKSPTRSIKGRVISAEIVGYENYFVPFEEAYYEEVKENG